MKSIVVNNRLDLESSASSKVFAYGDRDDPQRTLVLVAELVARRLPQRSDVQDLAATCLHARTPWQARCLALQNVLAAVAGSPAGAVIELVDLDALAPSGGDDWSGDRSPWMRRELYGVLLKAIGRGGWRVHRPCPSMQVTRDLSDFDLDSDDIPSKDADLEQFAPEVRPVATWLVSRDVLRQRDLRKIWVDVEDSHSYIVDLAYDVMPARTRDAAKLLSVLRTAQRLGPQLGSFQVSEGPPTARTVPPSAVRDLMESGFLQRCDSHSVRLPRTVRARLQRFSALGMAEQVRAAHLRQAIDLASSTTVADALETHHHAVAAKDLSLAKHTARYDGTELRVLGTQLSAEASRTQSPRLFLQAAELFEYIVSNFDATDAYSWEYYGYNLARSGDLNCAPRVLEAYRNAARLWPDNPLYSGRLLGLRGELGENIVPEFVAALDAYIRNSSEDYDIISFFSEAVVKGLMRQRQGDQLAAIFAQRRAVLERFAPRAAALASSSREGGNS